LLLSGNGISWPLHDTAMTLFSWLGLLKSF